MKNIYLFLIALTIFSSCGKSAKEVEQENIIAATKIHDQKVKEATTKKIAELNSELTKIPAALIEVNKKIEEIKKKNSSSVNKELNEGYNEKGIILSYEKSIKHEITSLENLKTFEFQKKPENLINYIVESCRKNDLSNFRYLTDPYLENTADITNLSLIETLTVKKQQELRIKFLQIKTIGTPKIEGDKAIIEYKSDINVNETEKITMINRNGNWYLFSL